MGKYQSKAVLHPLDYKKSTSLNHFSPLKQIEKLKINRCVNSNMHDTSLYIENDSIVDDN